MEKPDAYKILPKTVKLLLCSVLGLILSVQLVSAQSISVITPAAKTGPAENDRMEPYLVKEYDLTGNGSLTVLTFSGNIEVLRNSEENQVRVELYLERGLSIWSFSRNLDNYRITNIQRGNDIIATVEKKSGDTGFFSDQINFSYKVYVPETISSDLTTRGGNISLDAITGKQIAKSSGGNISISNVAGEIKAYTRGGNINISKSRGTIFSQTNGGIISLDRCRGELRVRASGGKIISEQTSGTMVAEVGSGDISAHFLTVDRGITLKTSAGNIFVTVPELGYELYLRGTKVDFEQPGDFSGTQNSNFVRGQFMDGGIPVSLTTATGTVTLKIRN